MTKAELNAEAVAEEEAGEEDEEEEEHSDQAYGAGGSADLNKKNEVGHEGVIEDIHCSTESIIRIWSLHSLLINFSKTLID